MDPSTLADTIRAAGQLPLLSQRLCSLLADVVYENYESLLAKEPVLIEIPNEVVASDGCLRTAEFSQCAHMMLHLLDDLSFHPLSLDIEVVEIQPSAIVIKISWL